MRYVAIAVILVLLSSCSIVEPGGDDTFVRIENDSSVNFSEVILDLGNTERSRVVFSNVTPSSTTKFASVEDAFSQPFTVRVHANGQHFRVDVEAVVAIPLDPGSYTYTLWLDDANRLRVGHRTTAME